MEATAISDRAQDRGGILAEKCNDSHKRSFPDLGWVFISLKGRPLKSLLPHAGEWGVVGKERNKIHTYCWIIRRVNTCMSLSWGAALEDQWTEHHCLTDSLTDSRWGKVPLGERNVSWVRTAPVDKHFQKAGGACGRTVLCREEPSLQRGQGS